MVQLLADESVDFRIVEALRSYGHLVDAIVEDKPGYSDDQVLELAMSQNKI